MGKHLVTQRFWCLALVLLVLLPSCKRTETDPVDILVKSYYKCRDIQEGHIKVIREKEYLTGGEVKYVYEGPFKKVKGDSLSSVIFHFARNTARNRNDSAVYQVTFLYTGNEYATYFKTDSTGSITEKAVDLDGVEGYLLNHPFFEPLTSRDGDFLSDIHAFRDSIGIENDTRVFTYLGRETVNGYDTYHVRMENLFEEVNIIFDMVRTEHHYWINIEDWIPIQFTIASEAYTDVDTMYEFDKVWLESYDVNNPVHDSLVSLESIPPYVTLSDSIQSSIQEPLAVGASAPLWEFTSLDGRQIKLSNYKGDLVLLDFFYLSCYPCRLAMPKMQKLHQNYADQGLKVIGIDPIDDDPSQVGDFFEKRDYNYTVVLTPREFAKTYKVTGYPTLYLVDKYGQIIYTNPGYNESSMKELEELIIRNL